LDNPGIYLAQVPNEDIIGRRPIKKEQAWDYYGNNTGYLKILLDYARPQHEPWSGSAECMGLKISFARRRTLPRTALASFPGSGNTWLRYLIQGATGLFTGSIYNDRQLASKGFYGESDPVECGCTIVVKTHGYTLGALPETKEKRMKIMDKFYGRGILLLRNPYDTLIAFRNYQSGGHLGIASPLAFRGAHWSNFVHTQVKKWGAFATDWITGSRNLHIVNFEEMQEDPKRELRKILQFLHLRPDGHRLQCVLDNLNGAFRRKTPNNIYYRQNDPYTEELHKAIEETIKKVNTVLHRHGRAPLPSHLYGYHTESENTQKFNQNSITVSKHIFRTSEYLSSSGSGTLLSELTARKATKTKNFRKSQNSVQKFVGIEKKKNIKNKAIKLYPWIKNR
ncbi:WSC domain-containing protein 1, partial [Halocaridina rubra]